MEALATIKDVIAQNPELLRHLETLDDGKKNVTESMENVAKYFDSASSYVKSNWKTLLPILTAVGVGAYLSRRQFAKGSEAGVGSDIIASVKKTVNKAMKSPKSALKEVAKVVPAVQATLSGDMTKKNVKLKTGVSSNAKSTSAKASTKGSKKTAKSGKNMSQMRN